MRITRKLELHNLKSRNNPRMLIREGLASQALTGRGAEKIGPDCTYGQKRLQKFMPYIYEILSG